MNEIKKGDIVVRKSYGKDILFCVKRIIKTEKEKIAILYGIVQRIEADSKLDDLEVVDKKEIKKIEDKIDKKIKEKIENEKYKGEKNKNKAARTTQKNITGKILHLDGDKKYSQKSYYYYKKLGLNAVVKNIPEYKQSRMVYSLLKIYKPDILIITRAWWNDKKRSQIWWHI